jgi:hypothetical protein
LLCLFQVKTCFSNVICGGLCYVQWVEVRGHCLLCWCLWNYWPSLFKLSIHHPVYFLFAMFWCCSNFPHYSDYISIWTILLFYCENSQIQFKNISNIWSESDSLTSKREGKFGFVCLFVFVCVKIVMNFEMSEKYVVIQGANNSRIFLLRGARPQSPHLDLHIACLSNKKILPWQWKTCLSTKSSFPSFKVILLCTLGSLPKKIVLLYVIG